jgi:hypothetical protein
MSTHYKRYVDNPPAPSSSASSALPPVVTTVATTRANKRQLDENKTYSKWNYVHSKLYLLIYEISNGTFSHPEAQECLSILASCPAISILATSSLLNVNLLFNSLTFFHCNWRFLCINTYEFSKLTFSHPFIKGISASSNGIIIKESTGDALLTILDSFAKRHVDFLVDIAKYYQIAKKANEHEIYLHKITGGIMIPINEVINCAKKKGTANSKGELLILLKEFVDHKILSHVYDTKGEFISFCINEDDFEIVIAKYGPKSKPK